MVTFQKTEPKTTTTTMPRNRPERHIPGTIVFDVNETLLDISALDPLFSQHFGDAATRKDWFSQVLLTAMTTTLIGDYADFARVGTAALGMVAERQGVELAREQEQEILSGMRRLPPHPESETALRALRNAGYQIVALTNSSPQMVQAQIENSGLANYFDQLLSVDAVGKFKPSREVYEMAEKTLAEHPADLWLIAAHNWTQPVR